MKSDDILRNQEAMREIAALLNENKEKDDSKIDPAIANIVNLVVQEMEKGADRGQNADDYMKNYYPDDPLAGEPRMPFIIDEKKFREKYEAEIDKIGNNMASKGTEDEKNRVETMEFIAKVVKGVANESEVILNEEQVKERVENIFKEAKKNKDFSKDGIVNSLDNNFRNFPTKNGHKSFIYEVTTEFDSFKKKNPVMGNFIIETLKKNPVFKAFTLKKLGMSGAAVVTIGSALMYDAFTGGKKRKEYFDKIKDFGEKYLNKGKTSKVNEQKNEVGGGRNM